MIAALKVTRQEKRKRQMIKRELNGLKEEFTKLKGMVHLMVALLNLQNHRVPTEDIQDIFDSQIVEESLEEEEIPQENVVAIPVPGPSMEILTGGEGSIIQWVHGEFIVISEAICSHFTHQAHGEYFQKELSNLPTLYPVGKMQANCK